MKRYVLGLVLIGMLVPAAALCQEFDPEQMGMQMKLREKQMELDQREAKRVSVADLVQMKDEAVRQHQEAADIQRQQQQLTKSVANMEADIKEAEKALTRMKAEYDMMVEKLENMTTPEAEDLPDITAINERIKEVDVVNRYAELMGRFKLTEDSADRTATPVSPDAAAPEKATHNGGLSGVMVNEAGYVKAATGSSE